MADIQQQFEQQAKKNKFEYLEVLDLTRDKKQPYAYASPVTTIVWAYYLAGYHEGMNILKS